VHSRKEAHTTSDFWSFENQDTLKRTSKHNKNPRPLQLVSNKDCKIFFKLFVGDKVFPSLTSDPKKTAGNLFFDS
jgi:hypothetical protein